MKFNGSMPVPEFEGYCIRERRKVLVANGERAATKSGRKMLKGRCPGCGAVITRFLPLDTPVDAQEGL